MRFLDCSLGGAPSGGLRKSWRRSQSQDEGILASHPSGVGHNNVVLRPRNGLNRFPSSRSRRSPGEEGRGQGRASPEETAAISQEAQGWRRNKLASSNAVEADCPKAALSSVPVLTATPGEDSIHRPDGLGSEVRPCKVSSEVFSRKIPCCPKQTEVDHDCFGVDDPSFDPWTSLQEFSFLHWCRSLPGLCLRTRTPFAAFLRKTLHASSGIPSAAGKALFPLPFPKLGVFEWLSPRTSSRKRKRIEFDRAFHVLVCALNFLHADCSFVPMDLMLRVPSSQQACALGNLRSLLKAFGNPGGSFSVPQSGRRSINLLSSLADLSRFVTVHGLTSDPYHRGFAGVDQCEPRSDVVGVGTFEPDLSRAEELVPYRALDPSRVKLTGTANWDPVPYLGDVFSLPFLEPKVLQWTRSFDENDLPDLQRENPDDVLNLAKIWDRNGLLSILPCRVEEWAEQSCMRCFGCYKSALVDRLICDRRGRNQLEVGLPGPSRYLPTGASLSLIEVDASTCFLTASASDRKDYYHQLRVSQSRSNTNVMWPPLPFRCFDGTSAAAALSDGLRLDSKLSREAAGDYLGAGGKRAKKSLPKADDLVHATFSAIPQGDHLGVEFATQSHRSLLQHHGLLGSDSELTSALPWRGGSSLQGLVIDDFPNPKLWSVKPPGSTRRLACWVHRRRTSWGRGWRRLQGQRLIRALKHAGEETSPLVLQQRRGCPYRWFLSS